MVNVLPSILYIACCNEKVSLRKISLNLDQNQVGEHVID